MSSEFKYTADDGTFSKAQREFYEENGYILFKNLVPHDVLDASYRRFIDICDQKVESNGMLVMKDKQLAKDSSIKGERLINKIQDFLFDDVLFQYASHPTVTGVIRNIIGPNVTAAHSMLINKPPDSTTHLSRHPTHQDLHYFPFRPTNRIAASWTAMERIDVSNGCLYVIPGSHKMNYLYPHVYPTVENKLYHGVEGFDHVPTINLIMEKGDTVFFHPLLLHGSGPNLTKGYRKAISCHYADSNSHFIDVRGTTQEQIAKEVEEITLRKAGAVIPYANFWKYKSRLICGQPGEFQRIDSHL